MERSIFLEKYMVDLSEEEKESSCALLTGRCTTSARPLLRGTCFVARRQGDDRRGDSLDPSKFGLELPDLFNGPGRFTGPQS
jgi:hypothetical protein